MLQSRRFFQPEVDSKHSESEWNQDSVTQMLTAKFGSIWPSCFRGEDYNMKKLIDGRQMPSDGNTSHGPWAR